MKKTREEFPGGSVVRIQHFHCQGLVQLLIRELWSHKPCDTAKNKKKKGEKTTMRYHLTLVRTTIIKKNTENKCWQRCREKGTLAHCWGKCKLVQPLGKMVWKFLKSLKIELPYDPAIPLLGIYLKKKPLIWKDMCTPMFIAAFFTIAKDREAT